MFFLPVSFLMASLSGAMLAAYFMNRPLPFLSEVLTGGAALVVVLVFLGVGIAGREKIEIGFKVEFLFVSILILSVFLLIASDKPSVQSHHDYSHRQALQTQLQAPGRPESGAVYDLFYVSKRNLDGNSETIMSRLPPGIPAMDRNLEKIPGSESFRAVPSGGSMVYIHSLFIDYEGTLYEMGYDIGRTGVWNIFRFFPSWSRFLLSLSSLLC